MKKRLDMLFALGRPFSAIYSHGMSIRRQAYQKGIFKTRRLPRPVISIGNLSLGGTGKTPHVVALAEWLSARGFRPAIVSRGYGGKAGRGPVIVSDGRTCLEDAAVAGDEPFMMAEALSGVPVIAGSDRVRCAQEAISRFGSRMIILDDGFQHLQVRRDLDIVLLPAASPLGTGKVFPGGDLRESPRAIKRASAIILSKCEQVPFNHLELIRNDVGAIAPGIPIFFSRTAFKAIRLPESGKILTASLPPPVYCFCGLASPGSFLSIIERQKMEIVGRKFFRDHYPYKKRDLSHIFDEARLRGAQLVLTTAKDFARIRGTWRRDFAGEKELPQLGIVEIEAEPDPPFWHFIESRLSDLC